MQVISRSDLGDFLNEVRPFLEKEKVVHSFILSLAEKFLKLGKPVHRTFIVCDRIVELAALQTEANRALIVSAGSKAAVRELADHILKNRYQLPGIYGLSPVVEQLSRELKADVRMSTGLRLFRLETVIAPKSTTGQPRLARLDDVNLIMTWQKEFHAEAVPNDPVMTDPELRKYVEASINQKQWFIWEDRGRPVCMVGSMRETDIDRWIAPVYTPPTLRGRGYGTALTAYVSQVILDSGKAAMLNTDLANPISNSIYQKIGYEPVADFTHDIYTEIPNG